jgi:uncharacterized membrane protein YfcA
MAAGSEKDQISRDPKEPTTDPTRRTTALHGRANLRRPFCQRAFRWCVPIGGLGGLVGLGGGEFRLPVLMYGLGFDAKAAVLRSP